MRNKLKKIISSLLIIVFLITPTYSIILQMSAYNIQQILTKNDYKNINQDNLNKELGTILDYEDEESWVQYYKNFIFNNGLVKFTFYKNNGNIEKQLYIAPSPKREVYDPNENTFTEYNYSNPVLSHPSILGEKSLILNPGIIDIPNRADMKFSTNIPFFGNLDQIQLDSKKLNDNADVTIGDVDNLNDLVTKIINDGWLQNINENDSITKNNKDDPSFLYIYNTIKFNSWKDAKNFNEWLNEENLKKLDEEIKFGLKDNNGNEVNVIDWINQSSENGIMNSIKVEPITYYPDSTEEIYCSNKDISNTHNLTYGLLKERTEEQLKKLDLWGKGFFENIGSSLDNFFGTHDYNIFCHIGILAFDFNSGGTADKDAGYQGFLFDKKAGHFNRNLVSLSYKETENHIRNWVKTNVFSEDANLITTSQESEFCNPIFFLFSEEYQYQIFVNNLYDNLQLDEDIDEEMYNNFWNELYNNEFQLTNQYKNLYKHLGLIKDINDISSKNSFEEFKKQREILNKDPNKIKKIIKQFFDENPTIQTAAQATWFNFSSPKLITSEDAIINLYLSKHPEERYLFADSETGNLKLFNINVNAEKVCDEVGYEIIHNHESNGLPELVFKRKGIIADLSELLGISRNNICYILTDHKSSSCVIIKSKDENEEKTLQFLLEKGYLKPSPENMIDKQDRDIYFRLTSEPLRDSHGKLTNGTLKDTYNWGAALILPTNLATKSETTPSEATEATNSDADPLTHDGFILYEDELSYVYTYDDIGNLDTRKLTGTVNYGGVLHGSLPICGCGAQRCSTRTSGTITVNVKHSAPYENHEGDADNCILNKNYSTKGDGDYPLFGQEWQTLTYLNGTEIDHAVIGYRDKAKDLRTYYNNLNNGNYSRLADYGMSGGYNKPYKDETVGISDSYEDEIHFIYDFKVSGSTNKCHRYGDDHCIDEECDEDGCWCAGWCYGHICPGGEVSVSLDDTDIPQSNIKNVYDNVTFTQYRYTGSDNTYGTDDILKSDTRPNIYIDNSSIGSTNNTKLETIELYPYIRMRYRDDKLDVTKTNPTEREEIKQNTEAISQYMDGDNFKGNGILKSKDKEFSNSDWVRLTDECENTGNYQDEEGNYWAIPNRVVNKNEGYWIQSGSKWMFITETEADAARSPSGKSIKPTCYGVNDYLKDGVYLIGSNAKNYQVYQFDEEGIATQLGTATFKPTGVVSNGYSDDDNKWKSAYIIAENITGFKNFAIAQTSVNNSNEPTLAVESQWDSWSQTMKGLNDFGITDNESVVHGGSLISLSTTNTNNMIYDSSPQDIHIESYLFAVPDNLTKTIITDQSKYYTVSEAKHYLERFYDDVLKNIQHYRLEKLVAPGIYKTGQETEFLANASVVDGINQVSSFGRNNLNKNDKYYFKNYADSNLDNNTNNLEIINSGTSHKITVYTIKSDIETTDGQSTIRLFTNDSEVKTFNSKDIKPNNTYNHVSLPSDWDTLNKNTSFVDNYIKGLEFDTDGGNTRNGRTGWYNEGQDGLSVVKLTANIRVGLNEKKYEINDTALTGFAKNKYDLRNWDKNTQKEKLRTVRYQLSPQFTYLSGDTNKSTDRNENYSPSEGMNGYIGTIGDLNDEKRLDVYLNDIQFIIKSKLFYIDNATVEDSLK